jgi:hypothetical protein
MLLWSEDKMAHFEQHCRDCEEILGNRHEDVNRWIDQYFKTHGPRHRKLLHHWGGVRQAREFFGDDGARAAIVHIVRDCGDVPRAREYQRPQGIQGLIIAPKYVDGNYGNQLDALKTDVLVHLTRAVEMGVVGL